MIRSPSCISCKTPARLTDGKEVYPHRPDLHDKPIWKCDGCGGYVGCHPGTTKALGFPADAATRQARIKLHNDRIDPLWSRADRCGLYSPESMHARWRIRKTARTRVYAFLADKLGIPVEQCHVGYFDIEMCRKAWTALSGVSYPQIRDWHKARTIAELAQQYPTTADLRNAAEAKCEGCRLSWRLHKGRHQEPKPMRCLAFHLREELARRSGSPINTEEAA